MTGVLKTHPLDLHEIRSRIALKLDIEALASCARVSRDWNDSFTPLLYNSIAFSCLGPSVESLRNNKHFVQHLTVYDTANVEKLYMQGLDNLKTVSFVDTLYFYSSDDDDDRHRIDLHTSGVIAGRFLYNNSRVLRSIDVDKGSYCAQFWNSVATCEALKEVRMFGDTGFTDIFAPFLKSCSRLDSLSLRLPNVVRADFEQLPKKLSTEDGPWRSMVKHLTIWCPYFYGNNAPWWHIVAQLFPDLGRLDIDSSMDQSGLEAICRVMKVGAWKSLHSISLACWYGCDTLLVTIIDSMVNIQRLVLLDCDFGPASFAKLEKHFLTLRELDISASSVHLVAILETCPSLEGFKGYMVHARDFTPGRQWPSSSRLRTLSLPVTLDCLPTGEPGEEHSSQRDNLYRLLSHLVEIETLDLKGIQMVTHQTRTNRCLDFSLESGLSCLHRLQELRSLVVPGCQKLGKSDAFWMRKHWPRLSVIAGMINVTMDELMEIREVFKAGGVNVALYPPREQGAPMK